MNQEREDLDLENEAGTPKSKDFIGEVWKFFSSMKLGLFLLIIIAVASIAGTLMKPDPNTGQLPYNIYASVWFRSLLGLLCLNLVVCSSNRWRFIVKALGEPKVVVSDNYLKKLKNYTLVKDKTDASTMEEVLKESLAVNGYRVFAEEEGDKTYVAAEKGRYGVLGSFITHLAFVVLTLGTIAGGFTGFESYVNAGEGQVFDVASLPDVKNFSSEDNFQVKVNKVWMDYNQTNGQVSDYYSDLSVLVNGEEKKRVTIEVNKPLVYNGVKFYQSNMGPSVQVSMKFTDKKGKTSNFEISQESSVTIPNTNLTVVFSRFNPDYDPNNPWQPKSDQPNNPAVLYQIFRGQQMVGTNFTPLNTPLNFEEGTVEFNNFKSGYFTGLSVRKDPGVPVVWLGSAIMLLGMFTSLIWQQRKIWGIISETKGLTTIELGGITEKNQLGLEKDFNAVVDSLKA